MDGPGRSKRCTARLALALALLLPGWVSAQQPLTLREAVEATLARAPQAQAALAAERATNAGIEVARQRPNPSVSVEAENFGGSGVYDGSRLREAKVALEWPVELGGKRSARISVASAEHAVARADATVVEAELVATTTEIFLRTVEAERRGVLAQDRLALAEEGLRVARVRVQAGKASPLEEQRAQVEQSLAQIDVEAADRRIASTRLQLERLAGAPVSEARAPWFDTTDVDLATDDVRSPLLARADADIAAAQGKIDLARSARIPDLTLSAGVRRFEETRDTALVVGFSVPLPLLNSGGAGVRRATAEFERATALRSAAQLELERSLEAARRDVEDARASAIATGGAVLAAATEAARIARIGYREGKFSQLDLLEAERALNQTKVSAVDALVAFHLASARLAQLQGQRAPLHQD